MENYIAKRKRWHKVEYIVEKQDEILWRAVYAHLLIYRFKDNELYLTSILETIQIQLMVKLG